MWYDTEGMCVPNYSEWSGVLMGNKVRRRSVLGDVGEDTVTN